MPSLPKDLKILAFDPGVETGVVSLYNGHINMSGTYSVRDVLKEASTPDSSVTTWMAPIWVIEYFILYPDKAQSLGFDGLAPARVIGMLLVAAERVGAQVVFQTARDAKSFVTDEMVDHYRLGGVVTNKHEKDAARHAILYALKQRPVLDSL